MSCHCGEFISNFFCAVIRWKLRNLCFPERNIRLESKRLKKKSLAFLWNKKIKFNDVTFYMKINKSLRNDVLRILNKTCV